MRAAPPVDYPVSRHGLWDMAACVLAGVAGGVPVGWLAWQLEAARMIGQSGAVMLSFGGLLLGLAIAATNWRGRGLAAQRGLRWDGQGWHEVDGSGRATELEPPMAGVDLGSAVLLAARQAGRRSIRWLPVERRSAPGRWHALRVALRRQGAGRPDVMPTAIEGRPR